MKKIIIICFLFSVCLLCVYVHVFTKRSNSYFAVLSEDLKLKNDTLMMYKTFLSDIDIFVNKAVVNCEVKNVNTGVISDLYGLLNTNVIIYKMNYYSCASCISKQIDLIKYFQRFENVIVLSHNSNVRHLRLFLKENQISTDIYQIENTQKLFENDNNTSSFFLNVNKKGEILSSIKIYPESIFLLKDFMQFYSLDTLNTKTISVSPRL